MCTRIKNVATEFSDRNFYRSVYIYDLIHREVSKFMAQLNYSLVQLRFLYSMEYLVKKSELSPLFPVNHETYISYTSHNKRIRRYKNVVIYL